MKLRLEVNKMKQLAEYTVNNLYDLFKLEEVCFIVEKDYDYIDELSYITDDVNDALSFAKENDYKIFIFKKKYAVDCLYPDMLFEYMLDDLEEDGLDSSYLLNYIGADGKKEFKELIEQWFGKYVGNDYWFADNLLGTLKVDDKRENEE